LKHELPAHKHLACGADERLTTGRYRISLMRSTEVLDQHQITSDLIDLVVQNQALIG
jgi:hypothetical protein